MDSIFEHVALLAFLAIYSIPVGMASAPPQLPYILTTVLNSSAHAYLAYIFSPSLGSTSVPQFLALNTSTVLSTANLTDSLESLTDNLPFLSNSSTSAFQAVVDPHGQIITFAGDCSSANSSSPTETSNNVWKFIPQDSNTANGSWTQQTVSTSSSSSGANFLSGSFAFQTVVGQNGHTAMYVFGGMCPYSGDEDASSSWQADATYTNNIVMVSSDSAGSTTSSSASTASATSYTIQSSSQNGGPIAEAGFSITPLMAIYSNSSGVETQSQNFLLLGGQTQEAFINMSQIAIYSLPEAAWSFVTVDEPVINGNTELTVRSTTTTANIDSRSGHTATLSQDGSYVVVVGGWVGDINTAADPQVAILRLGAGWGGSGDWQWDIPTTSGSGIAAGEGIYGHGALMLEGDVLMILGGYSTTSGSSKYKSRQAVSDASSAYFFNTTSLTWVSDYTNPSYVAAAARASASQQAAAASSHKSEQIGLGLGLGLGLTAVLLAVIFFIWYSRRLKKRRQEYERQADLSRLRRDARRAHYEEGCDRHEMSERPREGDVRFSSPSVVAGGAYPVSSHGEYGYGSLGDETSDESTPQFQIARKALHSRTTRGYYQPAPNFEPGPSNNLGTAGIIHPIYEADETEEHDHGYDQAGPPGGESSGNREVDDGTTSSPLRQHPPERMSINVIAPESMYDPFRDPSTPTRAAGEEHSENYGGQDPGPDAAAREREREISRWVADWEYAAGTMMQPPSLQAGYQPGRLSPTRQRNRGATDEDSGRTESNLSERSVAYTISRSGSTNQQHRRSNSLTRIFSSYLSPASTQITAATTATAGPSSVTTVTPVPGERYRDPTALGRPQSAYNSSEHSSGPNEQSGSSNNPSSASFQTAHEIQGFPTLRAEAQGLLPRPEASNIEYYPYGESASPSKSKSKLETSGNSEPKRQMGWLGSLRRALIGGSSTDVNADSGRNSTASFSSRDDSPTRVGLLSGTGAEMAERDRPDMPRRTVSAGAEFWRRKQGRGGWDDSIEHPSSAGHLEVGDRRSATFTNASDHSRPLSMGPTMGHEMRDSARISSEDEDWDIEKAVEGRVVQVMFTVPKEKLRVVNHDFEEEASDGGGSLLASAPVKDEVARHVVDEDFEEAGPSSGLVPKPLVPRVEARGSFEARDAGDVQAHRALSPFVNPYEFEHMDDETDRDTVKSGWDAAKTVRDNQKGKGKVWEMVERMESRTPSPQR